MYSCCLKWKRITSLAKLPEGSSRWSKNGKKIIILYEDGQIKSVFEDRCPHNKKITFSDNAEIDGTLITCIQHGACYNLVGGNQIKGPGNGNLTLFDYRITGRSIEVYC